MKPEQFLKLIRAPWAAYHDHPNEATAKSVAEIRSEGSPRHGDEVCCIYLCDMKSETGERARATRDLISQAPRMYQYIASQAAQGDTEAKLILRAIHGEEA